MADKKKIAFFGVKYFPSKGGVSRVVESTISRLKDEYDITIYCYKTPESAHFMEGVNVIQFNETPIKGIGVFIYMFRCYLHMMFKARYDLVHLHKIDAAFFLPLLSLKYRRILATSHESSYLRDKWGTLAKMYFRMNEQIFMRSRAKLSVISYPLSRYYKKRYNRDVMFVPNGVEPLADDQGSMASDVLERHGVTKPYVSFAARRIMATKGAHTMLKALSSMGFKKDIVIAGEQNHTGNYISQIRDLSTGLRVKELGFINDKKTLFDIIRGSELFIFPSETEGMSIMLLEVALLGTPIIASDIPENTAVFDEGQLTFFKDKDADGLAEKINWFYAHREAADKKAENAHKLVMEKYSGDAMSGYYRKLYEGLLASE